ncbi:MAG: mechanosensitive ion channel family protein [Bacteroidota bacterium]
MWEEYADKVFLDNRLIDYFWFIAILGFGLIFKRILAKLLSYILYYIFRRFSFGVGRHQFLILLTNPFSLFVSLLAFYFAFERLHFPAEWNIVSIEHVGLRLVLFRIFQTSMTLSVTWVIFRIVDFSGYVNIHRSVNIEANNNDQLITFVRDGIKILVSLVCLIFILGVIFHLNITSLITGLGIGGLAVALAAKETIENLLGSFTIFLDKPFKQGDLVRVGEITGNVERIGFRSTRIRTLEKSFVTIPNKKMVDTGLDNLSLRSTRRASFNIALTYDTTIEQIKSIVKDLKIYLDTNPQTKNDECRIRFFEFGPNSLNIMVLYFVNTMEYDVYLMVREDVNYKIMEIVKHHHAEFAFPDHYSKHNKLD